MLLIVVLHYVCAAMFEQSIQGSRRIIRSEIHVDITDLKLATPAVPKLAFGQAVGDQVNALQFS